MEEHNIHKIMLEQYIWRLYAVSGHVNYLYYKKHKPDIKRLKTEFQMIKGLVANIEMEIDNI